jgi:hypothetical protein
LFKTALAVKIEFEALFSKSSKASGVAPLPYSKWCQLVPTLKEEINRQSTAASQISRGS